mgnify:CR=1 FL=1
MYENDAEDELMSVLKKNELLTKWGEETFGTEIKEDDGNDSPDETKEPVYTLPFLYVSVPFP